MCERRRWTRNFSRGSSFSSPRLVLNNDIVVVHSLLFVFSFQTLFCPLNFTQTGHSQSEFFHVSPRTFSLSLSPYAQVATAANNNKRSAAVMVRFEFFFVSAGKTSLFRSFRFVRVNLGARAPLEFEKIYYLWTLSAFVVFFLCCFPRVSWFL